MTIVADAYRYVVGVDTHAATHHYAVIDAATGAELAHAGFGTHRPGLIRALDWIARHALAKADGELGAVLISMEGTRSYGTQMAGLLLDAGYRVVDAPSPKRERGAHKNDHLDAVTAARGALHKPSDHLADARAGETSATLQILLTARNAMTTERTRVLNALTALLRSHDLGIDARRKLTRPTIRTITAWRTRPSDTPTTAIARAEAIRLAKRVIALDREVGDNDKTLTRLVKATTPSLLDLVGVGPVNAARVLTAWSHPGRVRDDAAFAKLAGVCPLEVSSGRRHEHRLNRTGDRQLNRALHSIAQTRMTRDPDTHAWLERHQHRSHARNRRVLKRYIARQLHRHLTREGLDGL